jgi:hypothetical protein
MKYLPLIFFLSLSLIVRGQTTINYAKLEVKVLTDQDIFARNLVHLYDEYTAFNKTDTLHPHYHKYNEFWAAEKCPDSLHVCQRKNEESIISYEKSQKEVEEYNKSRTDKNGWVTGGMYLTSPIDNSMKTVRFYRKPLSFENFVEWLRKKK